MNDILLSSLPELAKMLQTLTSLNSTLSGIFIYEDSEVTRSIALSMLKQCQIEIDSIKAIIDCPFECKGGVGYRKISKPIPITSQPDVTPKVCTGACEDCDC